MIGERPNKKNIELSILTRKVNLLRLWRGNIFFGNIAIKMADILVTPTRFWFKWLNVGHKFHSVKLKLNKLIIFAI